MQFELHWRDGKKEIAEGRDIADAFSKAGYGRGAFVALDFYKPIETDMPTMSLEDLEQMEKLLIEFRNTYKKDLTKKERLAIVSILQASVSVKERLKE